MRIIKFYLFLLFFIVLNMNTATTDYTLIFSEEKGREFYQKICDLDSQNRIAKICFEDYYREHRRVPKNITHVPALVIEETYGGETNTNYRYGNEINDFISSYFRTKSSAPVASSRRSTFKPAGQTEEEIKASFLMHDGKGKDPDQPEEEIQPRSRQRSRQ
jgi:hypothetical protein